jgi:outer membrane receptor protein involved in Fe transport
MSNAPDGSPIIVPVSYVNFGEVESEGIELGLNYYVTPEWLLDATVLLARLRGAAGAAAGPGGAERAGEQAASD